MSVKCPDCKEESASMTAGIKARECYMTQIRRRDEPGCLKPDCVDCAYDVGYEIFEAYVLGRRDAAEEERGKNRHGNREAK